MYLPKHFREDRIEVLHDTMHQIGLATVIGHGPDGLIASHLPIEVDTSTQPYGTLRCHFAKPNPLAKAVTNDHEFLVIFQGPQSYISPNWYPTKKSTGKVVPTWAYVAIHAYGIGHIFEGTEKLKKHVGTLTDKFESASDKPWKISDTSDDFITDLCKGITGLEIPISRLEGKWKMNQNKSQMDVIGGIDGLRTQGNHIVADVMADANK